MKSIKLVCIISLFILGISAFTENSEREAMSSVVKVFAVQSNPDYHHPWQNFPQTSSTGSGCVIAGNKILTNAHVISNNTFLMVRKQGDPKKYVAKVAVTGHDCDLSLLEIEDKNFFNGMKALEIGDLPKLQESVTVLGYPVGGDNISVTEGVVSRIEPTLYSHSGKYLLTVQIDAAINPGNSGGPVVKNGKIVGVAFQNFSGENMGYMVPTPVINHFLEDVKDGKFNGFPDIDIDITPMENQDIRRWAKMTDEQTGILIAHATENEKKKGFFKENDVILEIDGIKISNDATIPFRKDEVIFFGHIIWQKHVGENCKFKILREGKIQEFDYKLEVLSQLVPQRKFDILPTYYIFGGFVFIPLSQNYIDAWGGKAPAELLVLAKKGEITGDRNQVVILSNILADDANMGYQNVNFKIVENFNGEKIKNLRDMISKIENTGKGFIEFGLDDYNKIVVDVENARKSTQTILDRYRIDTDRSKDLKK